VDNEQAKEILKLYRPDSGDEIDPQIAQALERVKRDPELARWFEQHCALCVALRGKFRQIAVPSDLKEKILAGRTVPSGGVLWWKRPRAWLAAAAALLLLVGLATWWLRPREDDSFSAYRDRMVRTALRQYTLSMVTNDLDQIRQFLTANQAHGDFRLTAGLAQLPGDGCAILSWHGRRVSLVCFDLGGHRDLFLFVINRSALPDAPATPTPELVKVKKLLTASWSVDDKTYILAGLGDEEFLRKFL
jgi:hypothetical protein